RLGQRGETEFGWDTDVYKRRVEAFGARALVIDGHDLGQIEGALAEARSASGKPTVVIARTIKGKGFSEIENKDGWHGKALPEDMAERAIKELGGVRHLKVETIRPEHGEPVGTGGDGRVKLPTNEKGAAVATRKAYGDSLLALGAKRGVVGLD